MRLLQRNFRCRFGEIDLIMRDGNVLVFVEVRHRSSARFGSAAESVTYRKLQRLLAAARIYLGRHPELGDCPMRFDLFGIDGGAGNGPPIIQWHREIMSGEQEIFGDG
ncbi:MAG: YraN family protein [Pseudomonadales bacterium]